MKSPRKPATITFTRVQVLAMLFLLLGVAIWGAVMYLNKSDTTIIHKAADEADIIFSRDPDRVETMEIVDTYPVEWEIYDAASWSNSWNYETEKLDVWFWNQDGLDCTGYAYSVVETSTTVEIGILVGTPVEDVGGICLLYGVTSSLGYMTVKLDAPLENREVINAATGEVMTHDHW